MLVQAPLQPVWPVSQQIPLEHVLPVAQLVVQRPQWFESLCRSTQVWLQFVKPLGQVQSPLLQLWPGRQAMPQLPQFAASVRRLVSQPFPGSPSQLAYPLRQPANWQPPPMQVARPWGKLQTFPQPPQLFTSVLVFVSQPSEASPLQSAYGAVQTAPHTPLLQTGMALVLGVTVHVLPQEPQLLMSARALRQMPLQQSSPPGQSAPEVPHVQCPLTQLSP